MIWDTLYLIRDIFIGTIMNLALPYGLYGGSLEITRVRRTVSLII